MPVCGKTDQDSILLVHKAHIPNRLYKRAPYISFYEFFFQISAQNIKELAFGFTEKHQFSAKTDRNSVFLGREAQILDRLHKMILYIIFYGV
jgi:hypothetical protein